MNSWIGGIISSFTNTGGPIRSITGKLFQRTSHRSNTTNERQTNRHGRNADPDTGPDIDVRLMADVLTNVTIVVRSFLIHGQKSFRTQMLHIGTNHPHPSGQSVYAAHSRQQQQQQRGSIELSHLSMIIGFLNLWLHVAFRSSGMVCDYNEFRPKKSWMLKFCLLKCSFCCFRGLSFSLRKQREREIELNERLITFAPE